MSQTPKRRSGGRQAAGASGRKKSDQGRDHTSAADAAVADAAGALDRADAGADLGTDADDANDPSAAGERRSETAAGPVAARLLVGAVITGLEGVAVAAWGIAIAVSGGGNAALAGLFVLLLAALPLSAAHGLRRARRWSRGPALIVQLLALPVAWTMLGGDGPFIPAGIAIGAVALTGLFLLANTATTDALGISRTTS